MSPWGDFLLTKLLGLSEAQIAPRQQSWSGMTVKYIHWGITLYVSCIAVGYREDLQQITVGYHTALLAVPWACCGSGSVLVASPSATCQIGVQVSETKMPVFWNAGYVLSVYWTFIYFSTLEQETALLCYSPPITGCLLLPGVNIFSAHSFFLPSTVTGEWGTDLGWWQSPCLLSAEWGNDTSFCCHFLPHHVELPLCTEKNQTHHTFSLCRWWVVILQCKILNLIPSWWEKECTSKPRWCIPSTNTSQYTDKQYFKHEFLSEHQEMVFLLWGWPSAGTGCVGRLWTLHHWRYSKAIWSWSWATSSR